MLDSMHDHIQYIKIWIIISLIFFILSIGGGANFDYHSLIRHNFPDKIIKDVYKNYGKIAALTFKRINNKKFILIDNCYMIKKYFYEKLHMTYCKLFYKCERKKYQDAQLNEKLTELIKCFPSIKYLNRYLKKVDFKDSKNKKDLVFIRFTITLLDYFYKKFDFPLYNKYKKFVSEICVRFYTNVTEEIINESQTKLKNKINFYKKSIINKIV